MINKIFCACLACVISLNITSVCCADELRELQDQQKALSKESNNLRRELEEKREEKSNTQHEISNLDKEINYANHKLESISSQLNQAKRKLSRDQKTLVKLTEDHQKQESLYRARLRFVFVHGKNIYLKSILHARSLSDFLKQADYINAIVKHDTDLLKSYQRDQELIAKRIQEVQAQEKNIQNLMANEENYKKNLEGKFQSKTELIRQINKDLVNYEKHIKELEQSSNQIAKLIRDAEAKIKEQNICQNGGRLLWPVSGFNNISSGYGPRSSPISGRQEFHTGIDIPAPSGTAILAAESGVVISSGNFGGYGQTVVISHGSNISTLYAHSSKLIARVGDTVNRGQTIALVGSTGYSTGNHCHFEVRLNGSHVNPMSYLSK